ncbi:hypothetical protein Tco_0933744 [Tanacetum coccineum]
MILTTNTPYPSRKIRRIRACTHQKTTKETSSIRRIQRRPIRRIEDIVCEDSGRYQTWSLLQETLIRRIQSLGYAVWKKVDDEKQEILELNEKIKKLERNKEIDIGYESCQLLHLENAKLKETQVKFVKFDKSADSLSEMLNVQKSPSCKIRLGFDKSKVSTSGTKPISFVGSSAEIESDGSTIKADGSTVPGFVDSSTSHKVSEHIFSPPMSL